MNEPAASTAETVSSAESNVEARVPDFSPLQRNEVSGALMPLNRLYDVSVTVSVELGRVLTTIGNLLSLGAGSVLELNRPLSEPVDLVADGVLLARGEVVVVDDCFAVRIKEIDSPQGQGKT